MRVVPFVAVAVVASVSLTAQDQRKKDADKPLITVTGCIDRSYLDVRAVDAVGSYAERYRLRGPKDLLKEISSKHNHHLVEITGAVTDTADTTHMGTTIQVGRKTRITTGAKDISQQPSADSPTLEVASYQELKERCR